MKFKISLFLIIAVIISFSFSIFTLANEEALITSGSHFSPYVTYLKDINDDAQLSKEDDVIEELEETIEDALRKCEDSIDLTKFKIDINDENLTRIYNIYIGVMYSNYDLYYVTNGCEFYKNKLNHISSIKPKYYTTDTDTITKTVSKIKNRIEEIVSYTNDSMNDFEKLLTVHDRLVLESSYDRSLEKRTTADIFIDGSAVCQGYATALYALAYELDIDGGFITSDAMNHMWNVFEIDDKLYHVDATNNDTFFDTYSKVSHKYFLKSDDWMLDTGNYHGFEPVGANDKVYDDAEWSESNSSIAFDDNKMYYITGSDGVCHINCYDEKTNRTTISYSFNSYWFTSSENSAAWSGAYSGVVYHNNKVYFNSSSQIFSFDIDTKAVDIVYSLKNSDTDSIYGCFKHKNSLYFGAGSKDHFKTHDNLSNEFLLLPIPVTGIELSADSLELKYQDEADVTAFVFPCDADNKSVTWHSTNQSIATVKDGHITAVGIGEAKIYATTVDGAFSDFVTVTITGIKTGDITGDNLVDIDDAIYLFQYSLLPDIYPMLYTGSIDYTKDNEINIDDAIYLFQFSLLPNLYPIS